MHVRIARFEGIDAAGIERHGEELRGMLAAARNGHVPDGVPEASFRTLADKTTRVISLGDTGRGELVELVFADSADAIQAIDRALDTMSPGEGGRRRIAVDRYEVLADERLR